MGLVFIGLFLIMGSTLVSRYSNKSSSSFPPAHPNAAAFGDTPFDNNQILYDNTFQPNVNHWNFTKSQNITVFNSSMSGYYFAEFNHSSAEVGAFTNQSLEDATYGGANKKQVLKYFDNSTLAIPYLLIRKILNVYFPRALTTGDIITLRFQSGNAANIYVRNFDSRLPPVYGTGTYTGTYARDINITLVGISTPMNWFNLDIDVLLQSELAYAYLDQVSSYYHEGVKSFSQQASINQTFTTSPSYNSSYFLNVTGAVYSFQNVQYSSLTIRINNTIIMSRNITGVSGATEMFLSVPHGLVQKGGIFTVFFEVNLSINTGAAVNFRLFLTNIYLYEMPNVNLLDDSECILGAPYWNSTARGSSYITNYDPLNNLYEFGYNSTETNPGGGNLKQVFTRNSTQSDFQLVLKYRALDLTGIAHVNLTVYMNNTQIGTNYTITSTSSTWEQVRINATNGIPTQGGVYALNISLDVKFSSTSYTLRTWRMQLDNISLFSLWASSLIKIGPYDGNVSVGQSKDVFYQYNVTGLQKAIVDATVQVYDNDTGDEWGLDLFGTRKYSVINYANGTYRIQLNTVGFVGGLYNLSVLFIRACFPDTRDYIQLNITTTVSPLNLTVISGAAFNNTHHIWWINEENAPYVDDATRKLTIYIMDNETHEPIVDAVIEAQMGPNTLVWNEIYSYDGYYEITMNSTGITPVNDYLLFNFSVRVSAANYSAITELFTTLINCLPTAIAVSAIEPFYQGLTLDLSAYFQDTFNKIGIEYANVSWIVLETGLTGQLDLYLMGFYRSDLPLQDLLAGNYTLRLSGEKENYLTSILFLYINIMPKYQVSIQVSFPDHYMEGNSYQVTYNFTYTELGSPLIGESINFLVRYLHAGTQENYNLFTSTNGLVTITIAVPMAETEVNITATYGGKTNVSTSFNSTKIPVIRLYEVLINIITTDFAPELVGGTSVEIRAILTYENSTPVVGATLVFRVSTSETIVVTDATGLARALVLLPTEGSFYIQVIYEGTSMIQDTSKQGALLTIISPATAFMNQIIQYAIYIGIIVAIALGMYVGVSRGVVRPRQRARQVEYVGLMNRFEDARNIQLLMIINRESGAEIFSKALSGVPVDPTLVSGFLQAITSFGKELLAEDKVEAMHGPKTFLAKTKGKAEVRVLEFHHFKIVLEETVHIRVALLLLKNPSPRLLKALHKFAEQSEKRFGSQVDQLRGRQLTDEDTWELTEECFEPSLIYVHMTDLVNARLINPTKWEKVVLEEIQKAPFNGEAYLDTLQEQIAHRHIGKELEIVDAGLSLRRKNVLIALSPRYMEVRLSIRKAIDALPVAAKDIILTVGDGDMDSNKIFEKVKLPQEEYAALVQQLQDLGILTEKFKLDLPGKLVYTTLKVGAETLKK